MKPPIRSVLKCSLVGLALASFASVAQSPLDVRIALVIGNAAYKHVPALVNSGKDAKSMAFVLGRLGFKVLEVVDGDRASMSRAIEQVQGQLKGQQAVAMLYYAGHGLQLDWRNYMVPVDARLGKADDVPKQTVDVQQVIEAFKRAGTRMNIIVLDACRDNPFSSSTGSRGLAQLDAPPGTYLAFATAPGNVAEDGDEASGNGLFTQFLLKELQRPANIESVFKRVRLQVRQKSQGRQVPWDSSSLEDEFAFNDGKKYAFSMEDYQREIQAAKEKEERLRREAEAAQAREKQLAEQREQERLKLAEAQKIQEQQARQKAEAEAREREMKLAQAAQEERRKAQAAQQALERARQEEAQRLKDIELTKAQAEEEERRRRMSAEAARERQFAEEKADWDRIKDSRNAQDFYAFLLKYPTGLITQQATFALDQLDKAKITAQADKNGQVQEAGAARFQLGDEWTIVARDGYTKREIRRFNYRVHRIENGLAYAKDASGTLELVAGLDGSVVKNVARGINETYDPPLVAAPGDAFQVGKKWRTATEISRNGGKVRVQAEVRIVGFEKLVIEAGTFDAYKILYTAYSTGSFGSGRLESTYWMVPDIGLRLKVENRRYFGPSPTPDFETLEIVSFNRGKR